MAIQFAAALPSQQTAVLKFLLDVFDADPRLNSFQPQVMEWKYFLPHPAWPQSRSFLLQKDQEIVGHGGVWPIRFGIGGKTVQAIHLVDWAASPALLGAGVHVLRSISQMAAAMITIGGSGDTRKILPKLGYRSGGVFQRFVRVVRPWLQLRTRTHRDWKTPLKFLRNARDIFAPVPRFPADWKVQRIGQFGAEIESVLMASNSSKEVSSVRTVAGLNYVLACPAAKFSGFIITDASCLIGYFILANVGHQARIVDVKTQGSDPGRWRAICAAAARTAADDPRVAELVAGTSSEMIGNRWEDLGFRLRRRDPIFYLDLRKLLSPETTLNLNLIDGDVCFMYDPALPYIS